MQIFSIPAWSYGSSGARSAHSLPRLAARAPPAIKRGCLGLPDTLSPPHTTPEVPYCCTTYSVSGIQCRPSCNSPFHLPYSQTHLGHISGKVSKNSRTFPYTPVRCASKAC